MSLLNEREAIVFGNLGADFPPTWLSSTIEDQEADYFERIFNDDFYDALIDDMIEYDRADPYDSDHTYALNELAQYDGFLYKSLQAANLNYLIGDTDWWAKVPKFETDLYDELWYKYLVRILSMEVSLPAAVYGTYKASRTGIMKTNSIDTGSQAATSREMYSWMETTRNQINKATKLMTKWIVKQTEADSYNDEFVLLEWACVGNKSMKPVGGRRFFFPKRRRYI